MRRAFTEQQELDLAGGALAISAEVLVDLLGALGGLLLAGGAHGAAHPRAGDGLLSARRRDGNDDDVDDNDAVGADPVDRAVEQACQAHRFSSTMRTMCPV